MKIKSLLLGSAAAMVAVSGAQAADAIVVEPEPVEFVRICDAYGSGYFYIPGTETCLRFSGFVRTTASAGDIDARVSGTNTPVVVTTTPAVAATFTPAVTNQVSGDFSNFATRARIDMNLRSETDIGTLSTLIRLEAGDSFDPSATGFRADAALISIAGFRVGQNGGSYWSTNQGFGGVSLEAATIGTDGFHSFNDSMVFDYTFTPFDGLAITAGVENPNRLGTTGSLNGDVNGVNLINYYAGFNYSVGIATLAFTAAHDNGAVNAVNGNRGGWAYSAALTLDLDEFIPGGTLHGMWQDDGDYTTTYVGNFSPFTNEETAYGVAFEMNMTDELQLIGLWNHADATGIEGEADIYTVGLNWFPTATPDLSVRAAYSHLDVERTTVGTVGTNLAGTTLDVDADMFEITLRRNF